MSRAATSPNAVAFHQTESSGSPNVNISGLSAGLMNTSVPSQVTQLFRTKRVSEIRQFEARIREEADDKSDALRQLLGTRYRDLLLAADRIAHIRDASTIHVRDSLRSVAGTASSLSHQLDTRPWIQPVNPSEPTSPTAADVDLARRRAIHTLGSRLKQIVDSPEVLYAMLEAGDFYDAAARFVAAKANYHSLLETRYEEQCVTHDFLQSRWSLVASFRTQVLSSAEQFIATSEISSSEYSRVLATIIILTEDCDIASVVENVLAAQTTMLLTSMKHFREDAVKLMRSIASLIHQTISSLAHLFWHDGGTVEKLVRDINSSAADEVSGCRRSGGLHTAVVAWTADVRKLVHSNAGTLLAAASHSRQIIEVLHAVDDVFAGGHWTDDCSVVLGQPPEFVFDILKPVICSRAAELIRKSVDDAVQKINADTRDIWSGIDKPLDASKTMWTSTPNHVVGCGRGKPYVGAHEPNSNVIDEGKDVSEMLADTGPVAVVLHSIDSLLDEVVSDVSALTHRVPSVLATFEKAIQTGLPSILNNLDQFVLSVSACRSGEPKLLMDEENELQMQRLLFVARVASALGTAGSVGRSYCIGEANEESHARQSLALAELCRTAIKVSCHAYRAWAQTLCKTYDSVLLNNLLDETYLAIGTGWAVGLDHEYRDGVEEPNHETEVIRTPVTASTGVMRFLLLICKASSKAGGFGLSREAEEILQNEVYNTCIQAYRSALNLYVGSSGLDNTEKFRTLSRKKDIETAALQLLFDIQYLRLLLRDEQTVTPTHTVPTELEKVEAEVQSWIDPIDLASSRKVLKASVAAYAARTSTLFGATVGSNCRKGWPTAGRHAGGLSTSANLVVLCKPVARFTYLPAPMPSTYTSGSVGTAGLNAKAMVEALRNETGSMSDGLPRKRETFDTSVAGYASKVSESVGRLGRGFFESLTRNVT